MWPVSVTVCIWRVLFLVSRLSISLVNILPSLLILTGVIIIILSKRMAMVFEIGSENSCGDTWKCGGRLSCSKHTEF